MFKVKDNFTGEIVTVYGISEFDGDGSPGETIYFLVWRAYWSWEEANDYTPIEEG